MDSYPDSALDEPYMIHQPIQLQRWFWVQADFEHQVKLERQLNTDLQRQHEQLTQAKVGDCHMEPASGIASHFCPAAADCNAFTMCVSQGVWGLPSQQPSSHTQRDCALT